ncbi:pyridine nucleotide-disulfide oxidoreductase [bacterium]|nr:MAG: pyridine nucleotide-disulfide oxidoreductase [bacterium]
MNKKTVVIIGGGAAGMTTAATIRKIQPEWEIIVLEAGKYISYAECGIPYYIAGKIPELEDLLILTPETALSKKGIKVHIMHRAESIHPQEKTVIAYDIEHNKNVEFKYDKLTIATGAKPILPAIPNIDSNGIFTVRSLDDAQNIKKFIEQNDIRNCVIIGAGFVGIEMAESFATLGLSVTVVEMLPSILGIQQQEMLDAIFAEGEKNGVKFILNSKVTGFEKKDGNVCGVHIGDKKIPADIVLVAVGVRPNVELARSIGLELGTNGAIYSDLQGATSKPGIHAVGDCTQIRDMVSGKWTWVPLGTNANKQGRAVGLAMAGQIPKFKGIIRSSVTKFFGLGIESVGIPKYEAEKLGWKLASTTIKSRTCAHYYPGGSNLWVHLYCDSETGRILGGQYIGPADSTKRFDIMSAIVANRMTVEDLAYLDIPYVPPLGTTWDPLNIAGRKLAKEI